MVVHPTSSVLPFHLSATGWRLGLIFHPVLGGWTAPGGHVERGEPVATTALRELREETGLVGAFIPPPDHRGDDSTAPAPWWIVTEQVPADDHEQHPHRHRDHLFVSIVGAGRHRDATTAHRFAWFTPDRLASAVPVDETHRLAGLAFPIVAGLPATGA